MIVAALAFVTLASPSALSKIPSAPAYRLDTKTLTMTTLNPLYVGQAGKGKGKGKTTAAAPKAAFHVFVNAKAGEVITGERTFRVTTDSQNAVTSVEFYVGSDLRDKDTSTPYEFTIDSLAETDGDLKLRFKAFTTEGESSEVVLTVKIDNGTSKGIDFQLQQGNEALQNSKFQDAVTAGRIALRIDPKSVPARVIVARGYLGLGTLDKAQKFAEDAVEADANNQAAVDLLAAIKLRQAFTTSNGGTDRAETLAAISDALKSAVDTRRKYVDQKFDAQGGPTDANIVAYGDAGLAAGRYSAIAGPLQDALRKDERRVDVANRLAYAQMRLGRYNDALNTLLLAKKAGGDAFTFAELAVVYAELGAADDSDAALKEALVSDPDDPAVLSAQAYLAVKFIRHKLLDKTTLLLNYDDVSGADTGARESSGSLLRNALSQLEKAHGESSITNFFRSALSNKLQDYSSGEKYFEYAVLADPLDADAYIEQGNRSLGLMFQGEPSAEEKQLRLGAARAYFTAAANAQPSAIGALAGLSIVSTLEGKADEAIRWGEAATRAQPSYAAGHAVLAAAYNIAAANAHTEADKIRKQNDNPNTTNAERQANETKARAVEAQSTAWSRSARNTVATAAKYDARLQGYELTKPVSAWRYLYTGGRVPVLPLPRTAATPAQ